MRMLRTLVGSGDKVALFALPFIVVAAILAVAGAPMLELGVAPPWLPALSIAVLVTGLVIWLWSVVLIVTNVPQGRLITGALYGGSRIFAPEEEASLSRTFGDAWRDYSASVRLRWL